MSSFQQRYIDINILDKDNNNSLIYICKTTKNTETINALLDKNIDVSTRNVHSYTALDYIHSNMNLADDLCRMISMVHKHDMMMNVYRQICLYACKNKIYKLVNIIIAIDSFDVAYKVEHLGTPTGFIYLLCCNYFETIVINLINNNRVAAIDIYCQYGAKKDTLVHIACTNKLETLAVLLLTKYNYDLTYVNDFKETVEYIATKNDLKKVLSIINQKKNKRNQKNTWLTKRNLMKKKIQ